MNARIRSAPGKLRALSWSRTVPRELVHRISVAEVLLTDVLRMDEVNFAAAACWPRSHPTFPVDGPAVHHPLMVVETLRQLGIFIPLRYFGVPVDARLLITDLFFTTGPAAQPRVHHGATEVTCRVRLTRLHTGPDGIATGLRLHVDFLAGGAVFARAGGGARFFPADRYAALRGPLADVQPPRASTGRRRPEPSALGVALPRDVVVGIGERRGRGAGAGGDRWEVVVDAADPQHPFFFDHATDHVPGMVLLEAARQAAALASGGALLQVTGARLTALRFTEFTPAARVVCAPRHRTCAFRFDQNGKCCAFGVLHYRSPLRV